MGRTGLSFGLRPSKWPNFLMAPFRRFGRRLLGCGRSPTFIVLDHAPLLDRFQLQVTMTLTAEEACSLAQMCTSSMLPPCLGARSVKR